MNLNFADFSQYNVKIHSNITRPRIIIQEPNNQSEVDWEEFARELSSAFWDIPVNNKPRKKTNRKQPKTYTVIHFYKKHSSNHIQEKTIVLDQKGNQVHDEELIKDLELAVEDYSLWTRDLCH